MQTGWAGSKGSALFYCTHIAHCGLKYIANNKPVAFGARRASEEWAYPPKILDNLFSLDKNGRRAF